MSSRLETIPACDRQTARRQRPRYAERREGNKKHYTSDHAYTIPYMQHRLPWPQFLQQQEVYNGKRVTQKKLKKKKRRHDVR